MSSSLKILMDTGTTNPFVVETKVGKIEAGRLRLGHFQVFERATGIELDSETIILKEVDKRPFTKIFSIDEIEKLNSAGLEVFWYIFKNLEYERDCIVLNNNIPIERNKYFRGIKDLKDNDIIAQHIKVKTVYWINPNILFKGNFLNVKPLILDI